jgi:hypothetical protein
VSRRAWILSASAVALILLIAASVMALTREDPTPSP